MIFDSGYIEVKETVGGGLVGGIPTASTISWGDKIPCHIQVNKQNKEGYYEDGKFTQYAYTIYFEMQEFEADTIRLTNNRDSVIKEFEVQSIEFLDLVQRVKVIV